jgi:hypothetical protein
MRSIFFFLAIFLPSKMLSASTDSSYDNLQSLLNKNAETGAPVQDVDELIPLLPLELRSNFTFIYQSRSPHGGLGEESQRVVDPLHPRLVLFSDDGKLVLAFNGNPDKSGYNILELIHFNDGKSAFEMERFVLPAAVKQNPSLQKQARDNRKINPAECLRCHGQDPRPITDSYPLWPGFYGSVRDTFPKDSPELPLYKKFLNQQKNASSGPYRRLNWPQGTSTPPYLDPLHYDPETIEGSLDEFKFLPNTRLGMALTELNRKRLQRKLKASKHYDDYKYGLLAGFLGCQNLPIGERAIYGTYSKLDSENKDRLHRLGYVPLGPGARELDMMELGFYGNAVQLSYLARALEISQADWSLAFEENSLSFFDGILSSIHEDKDFYLKEDFILEMLKDLTGEDKAFVPFFKTVAVYSELGLRFGERLDFESALKACPLLMERQKVTGQPLPPFEGEGIQNSEEALTAEVILKKLQIKGTPFGRCLSCHEGGAALFTGRKIAFENPSELRTALGRKSASSDRSLFDEILQRLQPEVVGHMPPH